MNINEIINVDKDILGLQIMFNGTGVPVETLFDHVEAGKSLVEFLDDFPTVSREQAVVLLDVAIKLPTTKDFEQLDETLA